MQIISSHLATTILAAKYLINGKTNENSTDASYSLSTVPLGLLVGFSSISSIPGGIFMKKFGYKPGLVIGALLGAIGCAVSFLSMTLVVEKYTPIIGFWILSISCIPTGIASGMANYYRHIAGHQMAPKQYSGYAISSVISAGVISSFLGPFISKYTIDLWKQSPYCGNLRFSLQNRITKEHISFSLVSKYFTHFCSYL